MKKLLSLLIALFAGVVAYGQAYQVKGVVQDDLGPVIGATVIEAGTMNGTSTGMDGDYLLTVSSPDAIVEISCMGYATQTFKASEVPSKVTLGEDQTFLEEVVVVGYGT